MESQETEVYPEQTVRSIPSGVTRCFSSGLTLVWALLVSPPAHAEEPKDPANEQSAPSRQPSAADVRKADTLFQKARLLKKLGKDAEACALFVESQGLDPNGGTLVNIAECHESEGKTGTAWRELLDALKLAKQTEDKELVKGIRDKLAAIVPRLYQVTIQIPEEVVSVPGVEVRFDDRKLPPNVSRRVEVVDPGRHAVHAGAPGYVDFDRTVTLAGEQRNVTVLVSLVKPPPPPPPDHTVAWTLVGGGVGGLVLGGGLIAAAVRTNGSDQVGFGVGGGLLLALGLGVATTGIVLRATAASADPPRSVVRRPMPLVRFAVHPMVAPGAGFVGVSGAF